MTFHILEISYSILCPYIYIDTGWWFGTFDYFSIYVGIIIIPTDFHIGQRGGSTTNQTRASGASPPVPGGGVPARKGLHRGGW
jgi:hypothetical protein